MNDDEIDNYYAAAQYSSNKPATGQVYTHQPDPKGRMGELVVTHQLMENDALTLE